ncbi:hypothetical protein C4D60_Mb11t16210 [Musa balbisiana]|uniref:Phloem protein 2-like protein n=1 Tax=Musa balbisiana TaxID=52838 RepID=A0A4S8J4H3_MUSBA|nr:hypothetical protein C4D60_Mb11t16210 [Musa balbisiana]
MSLQGHSVECHTSHWLADHSQEGVNEAEHIIRIPAKAMNITWGRDGRFWRWNELPRDELPKDFSKDNNLCVAELIQVNWLEVKGTLNLAKHKDALSNFKVFEIVYHIKFNIDAFGWSKAPVMFELVTPDGHREKRIEIMESYRKRSCEWLEIHGGVFKLPQDMKGEVEFGISETESHWWKGGMIFAGASIKLKMDGTQN